MGSIAEVFGPDGTLSAQLSGYTYRQGQQELAELVWELLAESRHAALEAGTGIGKTYAYLIPVLLSGRRAIISTGTLTLQDQLYARDLPALGKLLGRPATVALLKGRGNYLCWHRLEMARRDGGHDTEQRGMLDALSSWGRSSASGDITEVGDLPERLRASVTSTVDNCLGSRCDHFEQCFVLEARRRAQAAQVVIVNHHLLLADLALKETGFGELLPGADVVVVDEAHQLPDIAQQFFGSSVSSRELEWLLKDCSAEAKLNSEDFARAMTELGRRLVNLRRQVAGRTGRLSWSDVPAGLADALSNLVPALHNLSGSIHALDVASPGLLRCLERCDEAAARVQSILAEEDLNGLRWLEMTSGSLSLRWTPVDVGAALAARIDDQGGNWVFTSATLAIGDDFSHFLGRVGVGDALTCVLPSPFDYARNARLYLPQGLPEPRSDDFVPSFMAAVWPLIEAAGGGAFVLFTSYRALGIARDWVLTRCAPGPVLVQGEGARSHLLETFRAAGDAVLLGVGSFWQGVDVRGPALRLVAIDKLPFAAPNDPLVQAKIAAIRRDGGDAFNEYQLPQAALTLKQGVGRLIRDFDDRGLVVLGDPRLRTRAYGRVFLASLPPLPIIEEAPDALYFALGLHPAAVADAKAGL